MTPKTKVYIVDDHPVFRQGFRQIIQADPGFEVVGEAGNDETALREIPKAKPAVVVVDVGLPQRGGLELVKALRGLHPGPACLMLTMHGEESTFNASMDAGARGYLLKEDALELVLLGLKAVASGSVYLSPSLSGWLVRRPPSASALK